ncbi:hypothetical protein Tco_0759456 [Tanacetum coccineum]
MVPEPRNPSSLSISQARVFPDPYYFQSLNSPGLSTRSFAAATISEDTASMFSLTNRYVMCRLFLLIQSFSTSSDTTW